MRRHRIRGITSGPYVIYWRLALLGVAILIALSWIFAGQFEGRSPFIYGVLGALGVVRAIAIADLRRRDPGRRRP